MSRSEQHLDSPAPHDHLLQFYGSDEYLLTTNVGHYLAEGLELGNGLLVIATQPHSDAFARQMKFAGADPAEAVRDGRLVFLDADALLARFITGGQPDWRALENTIEFAIRDLQASTGESGLRAYDEMVGMLWRAGRYSAANRIEKFCNQLLDSNLFHLYCAYPIDVFGSEFQTAALDSLLCAHTRFLPAGEEGDLDHAIDRSMDDTLGRRAEGVRLLMQDDAEPAWSMIPKAEARILWIRNHLPDEAEKILSRARRYYRTWHSPATMSLATTRA